MQAACLARCNGARVELHRAGSFSLEEFREAVRETSALEVEHLIASYSRKEFLQTGEPAGVPHCLPYAIVTAVASRLGLT